MSVIETFSICSGLRSALAGGVGLSGEIYLSPLEVSSIRAGLKFEHRLWLDAIMGENTETRLLWAWLYQTAAQKGSQDGWEVQRGVPRIGWLAHLVCRAMVAPNSTRLSERAVAAGLRLDRMTYKRGPWPGRYRWLGAVGDEVIRATTERLRKEMYMTVDTVSQ